MLSYVELQAFATSKPLTDHRKDFEAAGGDGRVEVDHCEEGVLKTEFVGFSVARKNIDPLDHKLEHFGSELATLLEVALRGVLQERRDGVEVEEEFSAHELSALRRGTEAPEV